MNPSSDALTVQPLRETRSKPAPCADEVSSQDPPGFREYRAPQEHGELFLQPGFSDAADWLRCNMATSKNEAGPIGDLRCRARRQLIDDALQYTSAYRDVAWFDWQETSPIILAGHQPTLFHPGVWFKNFALSHLGQQTGAAAINLVVDNDVASGSSIRVPTIDSSSKTAKYVSIPYDRAGGGVPYEQTTIGDRTIFDQFDRQVRAAIAPIIADPCVDRLWQHARAAANRCGVAGCALAQARHGLEGDIGLRTLELPLGVVCRGSAFAEFALAILTNLPHFHRCYNGAADLYRAAHGIRSSAHPVPNLAVDGEWFEAPFWIYGNDAPVRKAAWLRLEDNQLIIADSTGQSSADARAADTDATNRHPITIDISHPKLAAEQLANVLSPNFKLRPRALLTTMYARLVLGDLFLHGIGGAKYDQLGDLIMRSFFSLTPPKFMVVSATIKLPGIDDVDHQEEIERLRCQIRQTRYQGERFVDQVSLDDGLLDRKHELLQSIPPRGKKKQWHDEIARINAALSTSLRPHRAALLRQLAGVQRDASSQSLLSSREHPFCLFPLRYLTETFQTLLGRRQ